MADNTLTVEGLEIIGSGVASAKQIARRIAVKVAEMAQDHSAAFPKIVVQNT